MCANGVVLSIFYVPAPFAVLPALNQSVGKMSFGSRTPVGGEILPSSLSSRLISRGYIFAGSHPITSTYGLQTVKNAMSSVRDTLQSLRYAQTEPGVQASENVHLFPHSEQSPCTIDPNTFIGANYRPSVGRSCGYLCGVPGND